MNQQPTPLAAEQAPHQADFVTALARGLRVIHAFGTAGTPMTLAEIARHVGLARATVRRSLITLAALGYVETNGKIFALTPRVLSLGCCYLSSVPLARAARSCLRDVSGTLNETSGTAILDDGEVVMLARIAAQRAFTPPGSRMPAYCTATGHVLLAAQPDDMIDSYLAQIKPEAFTPHTETNIVKIHEAIHAARSSGYALLAEQTEPGLRSISVPVKNTKRCVVAALNVVAPMNRVSLDEMVSRFLPFMRQKAGELGASLG